MRRQAVTRRQVLQGLAATSLALPLFGRKAWGAAPAASKVTPELVEAAKKEGQVVWYTAVDLPVAERLGKSFEAKYPGVSPRVERSGGERIFQRISQEYGSNIHAVDVVNSSDAAHFIVPGAAFGELATDPLPSVTCTAVPLSTSSIGDLRKLADVPT